MAISLRILLAVLAVSLSTCAVIQKDPWDWLGDRDELRWRELAVTGFENEVRFKVPDRNKWGSQLPRYSQKFERDQELLEVVVNEEEKEWPYVRILTIYWDWYWGGFYKEDEYFFNLSVEIFNRAEPGGLLGLSPLRRVRDRKEEHHENYNDPDHPNAKFFWEHYWIKIFGNNQGNTFIVENSPNTMPDSQRFYIPISDTHEICFNFYVSDKRMGRNVDAAWNKSRWDLVNKIMDTVTITPAKK